MSTIHPRTARADREWRDRARLFGFADERDMYQRLHVEQGNPCWRIAQKLGFCTKHIQDRMRRQGIIPRGYMAGASRAELMRQAGEARWNSYAEALGYDDERAMLESLYRGHSMAQIAQLIGVAVRTVCVRIHHHHIQARPRGGANYHGRR